MNIRYPIYEGVYRILTFHLLHKGLLPLKKRTEHVETNFINHLTIRDFIVIFTLKNNK